eukprot:m.280195 g.280195  ORF g.280195 m.280195 type:complete len:126 (-) comp54917_c0_seq1:1225-1602(-)
MGFASTCTWRARVSCTLHESDACAGVGRLVGEATSIPVVLPFWHTGLDQALPLKSGNIPRLGKKIHVVFGDPMDFRPLVESMRASNESAVRIRKEITDQIQQVMLGLQREAVLLSRPDSPPAVKS